MKPSLFVAALLLPVAVAAAPTVVIADLAGDDHGDGTLVYPVQGPIQQGDLDLLSLAVTTESDGLRFEATFRNPIRHPDTVSPDTLGGNTLSMFARHGFYAFNIDIYIDTDRVPGSGNTATLPGRRAVIAAANAWEKAIVLTPRPELMRRQLRDALTEAAGSGGGELGPTIDRSVFFPTEVRVRGRTISFFVPASFLGSTAAAAEGAFVAFVTGAKVNIESELSLFGGNTTPALQRTALGVMQPAEGRPTENFGYTGSTAPATPIVDLLGPGGLQSRQLAAGAALAGVDRNTRAVVAPAAAAPAAAATPAAAAAGSSVFSRALDAVNRLFGFGGAATPAAPVAPAAAAPSMQSLLQPGAAPVAPATPAAPRAPAAPAVVAPAAAAAAATAPAPARPAAPAADGSKPRDAAFFEEQELRLRALKRLRDAGLISEQEYQQKRKDVLDRL